jgi:outer membrane protein TolC
MKALTIFVFVFFCLEASGQEAGFTVEQAVDLAIKNNKDLKASALDVEAQQELKKTSFDLPKTDVNLLYGRYNSFANDNNITVSQSIPFTLFGSQGKYNRALLASSEMKRSVMQNDVVYQVKRIYYELAWAVERKRLLVSQDSIYEGFLKSATLRYKTGETNLLEQTTAEAQRNEVKNQLRRIDSQIINLQTELKTVLNTPSLPDLGAMTLDPIAYSLQSDTVSIAGNPSLGYARQQVEVAGAEKKLEAARAAPELLIGFFSQTLISIPKENGALATGSDRFTGFQVGISLPLWFAPHQGRVKAAEYRRQSEQNSYEQHQLTLESQYQQAVQQFENNRSSLSYYTSSALPNADLILKQSQAAYRAGEINYSEFLLGLRNAIAIKESYLQTLNDYNQSIIYLQYLAGNK